ncbi:MAG: UpxY family transcription antiterminator [Cyclobacteriaceae bacterium]
MGRINPDSTDVNWLALITKYRHEKKVEGQLIENGIKCYLPMLNTVRRWSDRKQKVKIPLFSCYLFVNISPKERIPVLQTNGAVRFVCFENKPAPIPDVQIQLIRDLLSGDRKIEAVTEYYQGQSVRVETGPLRGLKGTFVMNKSESRLLIHLDYIRQSMLVEIDADEVVPAG